MTPALAMTNGQIMDIGNQLGAHVQLFPQRFEESPYAQGA